MGLESGKERGMEGIIAGQSELFYPKISPPSAIR